MPIEISCTSCSKRLRVPDNAAGKRVKCPQCQTVLSVPAAGATATVGAGKAASGSGKSAAENFHLKTEDGQTFGPVPKKELDSWLAEGRITAECQLLKDGADQWQWASDVYPQLSGEAAAGASSNSGGGASDNPFAFAAKSSGSVATRVGGRSGTGSTYSSTGTSAVGQSDKSKMVAGLLGIFLGSIGVHRFYLGYTGIGIAQIFVSLFTCGIGGWWGIIEGIMILMGSIDKDALGRPLRD